MKFNRVFAFVVVVVLVFASVGLAASLDGTDWKVEITPEGATIPHHVDLIYFKGGSFTSAIFQRKGFSSSAYSGKSDAWNVEQANEAGEALTWKGEIQGEKLTGTLTWKMADGKVVKNNLVGKPAPTPEEAEAELAAEQGVAVAPKAKSGGGFFGCSLILR